MERKTPSAQNSSLDTFKPHADADKAAPAPAEASAVETNQFQRLFYALLYGRQPKEQSLSPAFIEREHRRMKSLGLFLLLVSNMPRESICQTHEDEAFFADAARMAYYLGADDTLKTIASIWPLNEARTRLLARTSFNLDMTTTLRLQSHLKGFINRILESGTQSDWMRRQHIRRWNYSALKNASYGDIADMLQMVVNKVEDNKTARHTFLDHVYRGIEVPDVLSNYHEHHAANWYLCMQDTHLDIGYRSLKAYYNWAHLPRRKILAHIEEVIRHGFSHDGLPMPTVTYARPSKELKRGAALYDSGGSLADGLIVMLHNGSTIDYNYLDTIYYAAHERGHHVEQAILGTHGEMLIPSLLKTNPDKDIDTIQDALAWLRKTKHFRRGVHEYPKRSRRYNDQPDERHAIDAGNIFAQYHMAGIYRLEIDVFPQQSIARMQRILRSLRQKTYDAAYRFYIHGAENPDAIHLPVIGLKQAEFEKLAQQQPGLEPFYDISKMLSQQEARLQTYAQASESFAPVDRIDIFDAICTGYGFYQKFRLSDTHVKHAFAVASETEMQAWTGKREQPDIAWEALPKLLNFLKMEEITYRFREDLKERPAPYTIQPSP